MRGCVPVPVCILHIEMRVYFCVSLRRLHLTFGDRVSQMKQELADAASLAG